MGKEMNEVDIDEYKNWLLSLKQLKEDRADIDLQIWVAENHIKDALGDAEVGTIGGEPVVRWSHVVSNRFDQKAAKELLTPDQVAACTKASESRRFTIVEA
jgi:predicted phage-related endonuclease